MASPILLVFSGIIALVAFGGAYYLVFPIFLDIQASPNAACQASTNCTTIFSRTYDIMFIAFEMMLGGIFFALFMRAIRKDETESYSTTSDFGGF